MAGFTPEMREWMRLVLRGASREEIFREVFNVDVKQISAQEANKYDTRLFRWRRHPDYHAEWLKAFKENWAPIMTEAMKVVEDGLHDESLPWRQTQHANLALAYGTKLIVGEEERSIHVKVEGMPEIGSPDES